MVTFVALSLSQEPAELLHRTILQPTPAAADFLSARQKPVIFLEEDCDRAALSALRIPSKPRVSELSLGVTLHFTEGLPERGNAKEIILALIYGTYSGSISLCSVFPFCFLFLNVWADDEFAELVEDFLHVQDRIVPSKELLAVLSDRYEQTQGLSDLCSA